MLAALDEVAAAHGTTVAAVALAWLAAQPAVVSPIASARTPEQLAELLPLAELELTAAELERLTAARQPVRSVSGSRLRDRPQLDLEQRGIARRERELDRAQVERAAGLRQVGAGALEQHLDQLDAAVHLGGALREARVQAQPRAPIRGRRSEPRELARLQLVAGVSATRSRAIEGAGVVAPTAATGARR